MSQLRGGLAGLVIAVIFAAAMSTLAAELSSLATATVVDFYKRFVNTTGSGSHDLLVSRVFTAVWGIFAGLVALEAGRLGSAIEVVNRFGSYFYGSILGVFALAILTPRASRQGRLLRPHRRDGDGLPRLAVHRHRLPLVQRRGRPDRVRGGARHHRRLRTSSCRNAGLTGL